MGVNVQAIGFVIFCIGTVITFGAKRIVVAKTRLNEEDQEEMGALITSAVLAVKVIGFVVALIGFIFIML
ncbi:MAG: hypothetical protein K0R69_565 [Clostridia bacterium]|nr:hypothetical protein [Clostridia bacterium]